MDLSNSQSKKLRSQCDGSCSSYTDSSETTRRSVHHHHIHHVHERLTQSSSTSSSSSLSLSQREANVNSLGTQEQLLLENNGVNLSERQMDKRYSKSYQQQRQFQSYQHSSHSSHSSPSLHNHINQHEASGNNYSAGSAQVGDAAMNLSCRLESQTTAGYGLDNDSDMSGEEEVYEIRTANLNCSLRREQTMSWSRWRWAEPGVRRVRALGLFLVQSVLTTLYRAALFATALDLWILSRAGQFTSVRFFRKHSSFALLLLLLLPLLFWTWSAVNEAVGLKEVAAPFFVLLNSSSSFFTSIFHSNLYIFNSQSQKSVQKEDVRWSPSYGTHKDSSHLREQEDPFRAQVQGELERLRRDVDTLFRLLEEQKHLPKEKESDVFRDTSNKALEAEVLLLKGQISALNNGQKEMETRMVDFTHLHSQLKLSLETLGASMQRERTEQNESEREEWIKTILLKLWVDEGEDEMVSKLVARLKKILVTKDEFLSFVSLTLELKQAVADLKSQRAEVRMGFSSEDVVPSVSLSEEEMLRLIRRELALYDADKLGLVDYALESSGGSVVSTRCSETYTRYSAQIYMWGIPVWKETASPRLIIQPSRQPGECWPFVGSEGYVVIKLSRAVVPTAFSLDHVPRTISPDNSLRSAPNHFSVWGLDNEMGPGLLLGKYFYDDQGAPLQTFPVQADNSEVFNLIELKIHSNHGHPEFTCVYRFRVHGVPRL